MSSFAGLCHAYHFLNIESHIKPGATRDEADRAMLILVDANIKRYQNELQHFQSFNIKCLANLLSHFYKLTLGLTKEQLATTKIPGVSGVKAGVLKTHLGIIYIFESKDLNLSYKKALIEELALNTEVFSQTISPQYRKLIIDSISKSRLNIDAELHSYLDIITKSMSNESCEKLCAVR